MSLFIGLSALKASQIGLDVVSQNIANANTPGYHRQNVHLQAISENLFRGQRIGSGVSISHLERVRFSVVEAFLTDSISQFENANQTLFIERQVESLLLPGDGSLQNALDVFFNSINSLAGLPSDPATRGLAVQNGILLADGFQELNASINDIQNALQSQIETEVLALNSDLEKLRSLNEEIASASIATGSPHELLDQRDQTINSIAQRLDVNQLAAGDLSSITLGNYSIQSFSEAVRFEVDTNNDGSISIVYGQDRRELQFSSGRLRALVDAYNEVVPTYREQIDDLASGLIRNFDQVHATGVGVSGPFESLVGSREIRFPNAALVDSGLEFPVDAGRLYISVVDPDGNRTTESIDIDPSTQSLSDIASLLSSLDHIDASVNSQTNLLQINSSTPGYRFDFTGTVETFPDLTNVTGTAIPRLDGNYNGDTNTTLSFEISGSGDVGISDDLDLLVRDSSGNLLETINIGNGYESGSPIKLSNGISVELSAGTFNDGDTFEATLVANPDEGRFLSAVGINSFFFGTDSSSIGVVDRIVDNPDLFAGSLSGDSAEAAKINEYVTLAGQKLLGDGRQDFSEFLSDFVTQVGVNVQSADRLSQNLSLLKSEYESQQNAISGVDVNEEFVRLTQLQNSFEAAVRVIQTSEAVLDELFNIIR